MYKESTTAGAVEQREPYESHEAPRSMEESPESMRQRMETESAEVVATFERESADDLALVESRAGETGAIIDEEDRQALLDVGTEAEAVQAELLTEIGNGSEGISNEDPGQVELDKEKNSQVIRAGQEKIHSLYSSGKANGAYYMALSALLMKSEKGTNIWKSGEEIDVQKVRKTLEYIEQEESMEIPDPDEDDEVPPIPEETISRVSNDFTPITQERVIQNPELLGAEAASKKFLAEERKRLAEEIRTQRRLQRERLANLKIDIEGVDIALESGVGEREDARYGELSELQSREANLEADRLTSSAELDEEDARDERENIASLIANSSEMQALKTKLAEHYAKADEMAKGKLESMRKTVEQTLIRNNAFIVHTFLFNKELRHNDNSNISGRATVEDDMDLLLSLEPSISTSSVVPGSRQGLWNEHSGVVLGGGDIMGAAWTDNGTTAGGIKHRDGNISSSQEIDKIVSDPKDRGYNELVVNNPKVFGFFMNVDVNESGEVFGFRPSRAGRQRGMENENRKSRDEFMSHMNLAAGKGLPLLVMTPDRKLFEFVSIGNDGIISVGSEITPEQVAAGKAGLSDEKRVKLGGAVVSKNLFRRINDQVEAKGILTHLKGQEDSDVELSREEYLAYARDNSGSFYKFPKQLLSDKEFMMEAAPSNPVSTYEAASDDLKRDADFIRKIYSLANRGVGETGPSVYTRMPDDLKKNESIALLAIENNDYQDIEAELVDSPEVWRKIVDKMVERLNPDRWFSREVGKAEYTRPNFSMKKGFDSVSMSERLMSDASFLQKLEQSYPKYRFEPDEYGQILVTKLA